MQRFAQFQPCQHNRQNVPSACPPQDTTAGASATTALKHQRPAKGTAQEKKD